MVVEDRDEAPTPLVVVVVELVAGTVVAPGIGVLAADVVGVTATGQAIAESDALRGAGSPGVPVPEGS